MLIALFTLLAAVVFGSGEGPFAIPNAEKLVKQNVEDKDRRKEMLAMMKDYEKEWKALKKLEKKQAKTIKKLNADWNADPEELAQAFEVSRKQREALQQKLIDGRLSAQRIFTPEEWAVVMAKALEVKPKKAAKLSKAEAKARMKQDDKLAAIGEDILAAFPDPAQRSQVEADLDAFAESLSGHLVAHQDYPERVVKVMEDGQASREEIAEVVNDLEAYRGLVNSSFLDLREDLVSLSTEEKWPQLAKALGKFF